MAKAPRRSPRRPWYSGANSKGEDRRGVRSRKRCSPAIPSGQTSWPSGPRLRSIRNPASAGAPAAHLPEPGTLENRTPKAGSIGDSGVLTTGAREWSVLDQQSPGRVAPPPIGRSVMVPAVAIFDTAWQRSPDSMAVPASHKPTAIRSPATTIAPGRTLGSFISAHPFVLAPIHEVEPMGGPSAEGGTHGD
jgi:hypothetical protein